MPAIDPEAEHSDDEIETGHRHPMKKDEKEDCDATEGGKDMSEVDKRDSDAFNMDGPENESGPEVETSNRDAETQQENVSGG